jgi:guanine deaminase
VAELEPQAPHYAGVYDASGLLAGRSLLAHGVHLTAPELEVLRARPCSVVHCAQSNIQLRSGLCDVAALQHAGVHVSVGTDVSGGTMPSMIDAVRASVFTSRAIAATRAEPYTPREWYEVLQMATEGNAEALGLAHVTGNLSSGLQFDALLVDMAAPDSPIDVRDTETPRELLERFMHAGDDRNIVSVFVDGRRVVPFV